MVPFTGDNGKQLYASILVLKAMEDKTYAGALIASFGSDCNAHHALLEIVAGRGVNKQ